MLLKKISLLSAIFFLLQWHLYAQKPFAATLQSGDVLFQDLDCGPLCDAIEAVTQSYGGRHFSHIGLVSVVGDSLYVIEAIGADVHRTPLSVFVARNKNQILLGRVKKKYRKLAQKAVLFAEKKLKKPYDDEFLYDNGKYYCSELLYDAFKVANGGKDFFVLKPMTFKKPNTHQFFPVWVDYYKNLNRPIPEAALGINPGGISRSGKFKMYVYKP
ncbi:MAG: YiiX/YebB-like N1pC/P60 family cysteine hydrolase [Phycisphaerales bacterium]|nr:YiiX/YebB-like N1pC/P60 family cysteine hydrolase [Phycisphaerales bacterium]